MSNFNFKRITWSIYVIYGIIFLLLPAEKELDRWFNFFYFIFGTIFAILLIIYIEEDEFHFNNDKIDWWFKRIKE